MLPGTAQIWIESLCAGRSWEQGRDVSRIRAAFLTLATTCDRWPSPKQFLSALPDSTQLRIAGPGERPADTPELRADLEAIKRGDVTPIRSLGELQRELAAVQSANRADVEVELVRHYSDRKSAAAGDA